MGLLLGPSANPGNDAFILHNVLFECNGGAAAGVGARGLPVARYAAFLSPRWGLRVTWEDADPGLPSWASVRRPDGALRLGGDGIAGLRPWLRSGALKGLRSRGRSGATQGCRRWYLHRLGCGIMERPASFGRIDDGPGGAKDRSHGQAQRGPWTAGVLVVIPPW